MVSGGASRHNRTRAAETARRREAPFELYEEAPVPYVTFDGQGIVSAINARARELLGIERHQMVGFPFRSFVVPEDRRGLAAHLARFRSEGSAVSELRLKRAGQAEIAVRLESQRPPHLPTSCWTVILDLTERKRAEVERARLEAAERAARDANAAKDRFIAVLSHELRAPLAPLLATVSNLEKGGTSPAKLARFADVIRRNVLREARLIDDLLDISRIASGKVELKREVTDLHAVAREALEMLAPEAAARRQSLSLELEASGHMVEGDPSRLRQVLSNMLKNALKFTPEGGHVDVRSWNNGDILVVEVRDDGVGIEPQALARIFAPFEQAHAPSTGGGLGLGLAISRGMVELHGGRISAHSAGLGRGARFLIELPVVAAQPARLREEPSPRRPARRVPRAAEILVVEDEPDLAEALLGVLESEGYQARAVATASAALAVNLDNVGIVISDIGLPDLDGRVLIEKLKAKHNLKAIALSGYGTEADVRSSEAAGFDQHLTKPVEMDVLLGAIDRICAS